VVNDSVAIAVDPLVVADRLRPVLVKLNRRLRRELQTLGVSGGQAALLHLIGARPGIGVRELADREGMSAAGMSGHVDRLERGGLVTRTRSSADRRRVGLAITDRGARVVQAVRSRRTAWLAARLKELGDDELRAIEAAIEPLQALLELPA
jgi:DNA-binding MarR family transcriptional regulator